MEDLWKVCQNAINELNEEFNNPDNKKKYEYHELIGIATDLVRIFKNIKANERNKEPYNVGDNKPRDDGLDK